MKSLKLYYFITVRMKLNFVVISIANLLTTVICYDCYNQKCQGRGTFNRTYTTCDQTNKHCSTSDDGIPECKAGKSGDGINCIGIYYCSDYPGNGTAYCGYYRSGNDGLTIGIAIAIVPLVIALYGIFCFCCKYDMFCRRRSQGIQITKTVSDSYQSF